MSFFKYTAKNEHGESVKGKVEAQTVELAASALHSRGLLVIDIRPLSETSFSALKAVFYGVKKDDIVNFTRQLATMITAGLPLSTGLSILSQQGKPEFMKMIGEILREIEGGNTFSSALEKRPGNFSKVYTQLVKAGETGGVLDQVLNRLADNLEKEKEFRGKIKGALIYPIIVVIAMVIVAFVMMIFVIPKLTEMYKDFGAELPFATQLLIDISNFTANFWWLQIMLAAGAFMGMKAWGRTKPGRLRIDRFKLKIPIFGILRKKVLLTDFARTLSLLVGAGISLIEGLSIVTEAMDNVVYKNLLSEVTEQVEKGVSFSHALSVYEEFPSILFQMISVGEETGKLDDILLKLAMYFQTESEQAVKNLTTAIEPIIMVVLGVGVALMVIAIIMPIYNLTSQF